MDKIYKNKKTGELMGYKQMMREWVNYYDGINHKRTKFGLRWSLFFCKLEKFTISKTDLFDDPSLPEVEPVEVYAESKANALNKAHAIISKELINSYDFD